MTPTLTIYLRYGCSLCEAMVEEIQPYRRRHGFRVEQVDIDRSPELVARYGQLVPVLEGERGEICHYFLDPDALERFLECLTTESTECTEKEKQ